MKTLLVMSLLLMIVACDKKTETPPIIPPQVEEYCKAEGKQFMCMSAVYFYGKECPQGGPVYVKNLAEMHELVTKTSQAVSIKMKDGSLKEIGVGFAMPCEEL